MKLNSQCGFLAVIVFMVAACTAMPAKAQQISGVLGSASATTTIPGNQLPAPDPKFGGVIKQDALQSKAWWAPRIVPPKEAPNVLLIITDDAGFGVPSTFGGIIPTPTMDRVAKIGLRYNNIHSTALCSPTRAALITGRNHHSVGFGVISEQSTGFPGYNSIISEDKATIGRILLDNGYATSWFGKDHNTPTFAASSVGPFDKWPTGLGFEYFYGFVGGDANQWQPNLFRNTTQIYPFEGKPGWNLVTGMADDAIEYLNRTNQTMPDKKFFMKYAPGATHAPHHPTEEWVKKIHDMHLFDDGYEKVRERIFENQKKLGVIPADTKMEPWPAKMLTPWDELDADSKKLFIKQVEIFAAYAAYSDHEIGRVIDTIEEMGKLDDTLIIYINGDNGTSAEGGPLGTPNEVAFFNGVPVPVETQMKWYDVWGTEQTYNHMSAGWSWAFDTPFSWFKQNASKLGGIRQNMAVSWPGHIDDAGGLRDQFMHVIDVVPTILEVTGIPAPETVDGIKQAPIEGTSFAYTFKKENAKVPSQPQDPVFRDDGPVGALSRRLAAQHRGQPRAVGSLRRRQSGPAQQPGPRTLRPDHGLQPVPQHRRGQSEQGEGDEGNVHRGSQEVSGLPDGRLGRRPASSRRARTSPPAAPSSSTPTRWSACPRAIRRPSSMLLHLHRGHHRPRRWGRGHDRHLRRPLRGYGFYLLKGKPVFLWNLVDLERIKWEGPDALTPGKHTVVFDFKYDGLGAGTLAFNNMSGLARPGHRHAQVDGKVVDTKTMPKTIPMILQWDESLRHRLRHAHRRERRRLHSRRSP